MRDSNYKNQAQVFPSQIVIVVLVSFLAVWISSGSIGLLAHPLRRILTIFSLGIVTFFIPLSPSNRCRDLIWRAIGIAFALFMTASNLPGVNIMAVAVLTASIGAGLSGSSDAKNAVKDALLVTSSSVAVFGVYRLAYLTIPSVWLAADEIAGLMGHLVGSITGRPLWVGVTFGGLDFLLLNFIFFGIWLIYSRSLRLKSLIYTIVAILTGHLIYLVIVTLGAPWIQKSGGDSTGLLINGVITKYLKAFSLWHFPLVALSIHLIIAGLLLRYLLRKGAEAQRQKGTEAKTSHSQDENPCEIKLNHQWQRVSPVIGGLALALGFAVLTTFYTPPRGLKGSKIVVYEHGFLNWLKPKHGDYGRLSIGMYGMLPIHIESLGGQCIISPDLSGSDLSDAQALILLYPNEPWPKGMLERIRKFVADGGSLLIMGEHTVKESDGGNRFNDVLAPTNMRVCFDSATFAIGGWLHSYQSMAHPAFIGISDNRNEFGVVIGASVKAKWPSRPLLIGRWGWADPGNEKGSAMMGNGEYDSGEKLGDLVLAAEERFGKGRIIVFGDTSGITNGIMIDSHPFIYRLISYLVNQDKDYQPLLRQSAAVLVAILLSLLLVYLPGKEKALCILGLVIGLSICQSRSLKSKDLLPDGRVKEPNNLAYIDSTHLPSSSEESWREDGTMGLMLNLMRNGYLTLSLPELTKEHLERAGLFVLIAPNRSFTRDERNIVYDFVEQGGILICMAGYEDCGPIRPLLSDFGFDIGLTPTSASDTPLEPQPLGHFKSPYLNTGQYYCYVRFHAAWPIICNDPEAQVMAYGRGDVPVIICRNIGRGKVVVIGDTSFAMNKNLEYENGEPFEGMRENAHFWHWLITVLREEPMWVPPQE